MDKQECKFGDCEQVFDTLDELVQHLESHLVTLEEFGCVWRGCTNKKSKKMTNLQSLTSHLRTHTGEKPFECPLPECLLRFSRRDGVQKHCHSAHPEYDARTKTIKYFKENDLSLGGMFKIEDKIPYKPLNSSKPLKGKSFSNPLQKDEDMVLEIHETSDWDTHNEGEKLNILQKRILFLQEDQKLLKEVYKIEQLLFERLKVTNDILREKAFGHLVPKEENK